MRSVILISPNKNEILSLYQQWRDKAKNIFRAFDRLNILIDGERIYIDYLEEGDKDYEEDELSQVGKLEPSFYSISYSDTETLKDFIQQNVFGKGSYIDNDFGRIILVDELREEDFKDGYRDVE